MFGCLISSSLEFDLVELMESELSTIDDGGKIACDSFINSEYLGLLICDKADLCTYGQIS